VLPCPSLPNQIIRDGRITGNIGGTWPPILLKGDFYAAVILYQGVS
jgi:hypothetical protein